MEKDHETTDFYCALIRRCGRSFAEKSAQIGGGHALSHPQCIADLVETNLSQLLSYSIFSGVQEKWLENSYLEYAHKMRKAARDKVDLYGYVQGVCGAPFFNSPGRATEGQASFILMEAAYRDYQNGNKSSEERANV